MIRVEVATHFNEDAFSYGLARGLADRIRSALEGVECAEHDQESSVRLSTEGVAQTVNDISIEIRGCCESVNEKVRSVVNGISPAMRLR
jgi:hypothetical protein